MSELDRQFYPHARHEELVVKELLDEVLVYDLQRDKAHCLGHTAAIVWKHCDGRKTITELAQVAAQELGTPVEEDVIWLALDQLGRNHLLQERGTPPAPGQLTRRQLIGRVGAVAAAAVVTSIIAPTVAQAFSCIGDNQPCQGASNSADCCSGFCDENLRVCVPVMPL